MVNLHPLGRAWHTEGVWSVTVNGVKAHRPCGPFTVPAGTLTPTAHSLLLSQLLVLFRTPDLPAQQPPATSAWTSTGPLGLDVSHPCCVLPPLLSSSPECLEHGSQATSSFSFSPAYNPLVSPVGSTPECLLNPPLLLAPVLGQAIIAATAQNWSSCFQSGLLQNSRGTLP